MKIVWKKKWKKVLGVLLYIVEIYKLVKIWIFVVFELYLVCVDLKKNWNGGGGGVFED